MTTVTGDNLLTEGTEVFKQLIKMVGTEWHIIYQRREYQSRVHDKQNQLKHRVGPTKQQQCEKHDLISYRALPQEKYVQ